MAKKTKEVKEEPKAYPFPMRKWMEENDKKKDAEKK
jgi:hypothetical protein